MFLCLDSNSIGPSVVVHTSVPFSLKHLESDKEEMRDVIMSHLTQVLPDLPQPVEVKSHKWRYSQVPFHYERVNIIYLNLKRSQVINDYILS